MRTKSFFKYLLTFVFIFLCVLYSFGALDFLKVKKVNDLNFFQAKFSYTGRMLDGKFFEDGTIKYENDDYNCSFKRGMLSKVCVNFKDTSTECECNLSNNTIVSANFKTKDGKTLIYENNIFKCVDFAQNVYFGDLACGLPSGTGKAVYKDQSAYEGEFSFGIANGKGIFVNKSNENNFKYEGEFKNGKFDGFGKYESNEVIYEGNFKEGLAKGYGKYTKLAKNLVYEGNFKNGIFDGEGTVKNLKGDILFKGLWKNGKRIS